MFLIYSAIIFLAFVATRLILESEIDRNLIMILALTGFGSALLPVLAGYYGKTMFFKVYTSANLIGLLSMFKFVIADGSSGWADLTSFVVYLYLLPVGVILALLAEIIVTLRQKKTK